MKDYQFVRERFSQLGEVEDGPFGFMLAVVRGGWRMQAVHVGKWRFYYARLRTDPIEDPSVRAGDDLEAAVANFLAVSAEGGVQ